MGRPNALTTDLVERAEQLHQQVPHVLSMKDFADALGISTQTLYTWLTRGKSDIARGNDRTLHARIIKVAERVALPWEGGRLPDPTLTPGQRYAAIELLRRYVGFATYEEASMVIAQLRALTAQNETGSTVCVWLSNLPRARGRAPLAPAKPEPEPDHATIPATVQHALRPASRGAHRGRTRPVHWLLAPDAAPRRPKRYGRDVVGVCVVCGEQFEVNAVGRPAVTCGLHRRVARREAS